MRHLLTCLAATLAICTVADRSYGADNIETAISSGTQIAESLWVPAAMPLTWQLNDAGVANNSAMVSNTAAVTELEQAFAAWNGVTTSDIRAVYGGESTQTDSGCALINLVTWSATTQTWDVGVIARGLTWEYVGVPKTLSVTDRSVACGSGGAMVELPSGVYPNGSVLQPGTIIDMDMTWNSGGFDYVTAPDSNSGNVDIESVAIHEFGHLFGFAHTSLAFTGADAATMFPTVDTTDTVYQANMYTLADDDIASSGGYPDIGFWPTGTAPYTTGAISGWVRTPTGAAATGVRVWAYPVSSPASPHYETFTVSQFESNPAETAGDYLMKGMLPGEYYVCIIPWGNGAPNDDLDDPGFYNLTTGNGVNNTGFPTECFDDAQFTTAQPSFASGTDLLRRVTVGAGATTPGINFATGAQATDFMLVMDRSGSMAGDSGTSGITKIVALQNAANAFIDYLDLAGGHRLGLVQFDDGTPTLNPVFDLQTLNSGSVSDAHDAIDFMSPGGWTNIIGGVDEGVSQLSTIDAPADRQIMLVFSDGKHNRPVGSDLNDIDALISANDVTMYSIGFGDDVDDAILAQVALNSGGLHVNEIDLDAMSLGKHFLSIAASAADQTTLIDPRYQLAPGESASLDVPVLASEHDLVFAVQWNTPGIQRFDVKLISPSGCAPSTFLSTPGVNARRGDTHRLVKVDLPYYCNGKLDHEGTWTITVTGGEFDQEKEKDEVQVVVFGASRTRLFANTDMVEGQPVITARLAHEAEPITSAAMRALVVLPLPPSGNSEKQDAQQGEGAEFIPPEIPREERTVEIELVDNGKDGDAKARDGVFSAVIPTGLPGTYNIRIIAEYEHELGYGRRERLTSAFFDGERVLVTPKTEPPKLRVR